MLLYSYLFICLLATETSFYGSLSTHYAIFVTSLHESLSTSDVTIMTTSTSLYESLSTSDVTTMTTSTSLHESLSTSDVTTMTTSTSHHQVTSSYYITYTSPPDGSSSGSSSDSDNGAIYATIAVVVIYVKLF